MSKFVEWATDQFGRIYAKGFNAWKLGPIGDGVLDDDAVTVRQLKALGGAADAFAVSVELWLVELVIAEGKWTPLGILPLTIFAKSEIWASRFYGVITLNRGTQWGNVQVELSTLGAGALKLGKQPASVTITAGQSQVEFYAELNRSFVGESVLEIAVSDGTESITHKVTVVIATPVVSGSYYGGTGLGEKLL